MLHIQVAYCVRHTFCCTYALSHDVPVKQFQHVRSLWHHVDKMRDAGDIDTASQELVHRVLCEVVHIVCTHRAAHQVRESNVRVDDQLKVVHYRVGRGKYRRVIEGPAIVWIQRERGILGLTGSSQSLPGPHVALGAMDTNPEADVASVTVGRELTQGEEQGVHVLLEANVVTPFALELDKGGRQHGPRCQLRLALFVQVQVQFNCPQNVAPSADHILLEGSEVNTSEGRRPVGCRSLLEVAEFGPEDALNSPLPATGNAGQARKTFQRGNGDINAGLHDQVLQLNWKVDIREDLQVKEPGISHLDVAVNLGIRRYEKSTIHGLGKA